MTKKKQIDLTRADSLETIAVSAVGLMRKLNVNTILIKTSFQNAQIEVSVKTPNSPFGRFSYAPLSSCTEKEVL